MRLHALLGVLAAISCARQATAWDYTCWDCVAFRASLWLPFSKGDVQSRQWAVAAKMAADQHRLPRRERGKIMLREQAGALLYLR